MNVCETIASYTTCGKHSDGIDCARCLEEHIEYMFDYIKTLSLNIFELRAEENDLMMCYASDGEDTEEILTLIARKDKMVKELKYLSEKFTEMTGKVKVEFMDGKTIKLNSISQAS